MNNVRLNSLHKFACVILNFLAIYFNFKEKEARTRIAIVRFGAQMDISNDNKFLFVLQNQSSNI